MVKAGKAKTKKKVEKEDKDKPPPPIVKPTFQPLFPTIHNPYDGASEAVVGLEEKYKRRAQLVADLLRKHVYKLVPLPAEKKRGVASEARVEVWNALLGDVEGRLLVGSGKTIEFIDVYWAMEMLPDTELRLLAGQLKILGKKFIQQLAEKYVHLFLVMRQLVLAQSVQLSRIINPAVKDATQLRSEGHSGVILRRSGFSPRELKNAGFDNYELNKSGLTAVDCANIGLTAHDLKDGGFSGARFEPAELREASYAASDLRSSGFVTEPRSLLNAGYTIEELKDADISPVDLRAIGVPIKSLREHFTNFNLGAGGSQKLNTRKLRRYDSSSSVLGWEAGQG